MIEYSVLIYSRNHRAFIEECIDSVLAQSPAPEEIVVFDGGSTDGTLELLQGYGDKIRILSGRVEGLAPQTAEALAINRAFAASRGEIVFFLDGDDRFQPGKIEAYAAAFERHPDASLVQAPLERIDARGATVGRVVEPRYHLSNHLREIHRQQDLNFFYPISALAFARTYLERVLPLDLTEPRPIWTDVRLSMPAVHFGRIITLADPRTDWRVHSAQDTSRLGAGWQQVRQMFYRAGIFNAFCRRHGLRTISPWRNSRLYIQLLRCAAPPPVHRFYRRFIQPLLDRLGI